MKATTPLVSIIMPAYNCAAYIEEAVRSVMAQTCESFELLVIDDGSKDDTFAIARRLAAEDARVTALKNPENMGVARTRNRGLDMARGEYVAFLDSDDRWHPDKLQEQIRRMEEENAALSYTSYAIVDADGKPSKAAYIVPAQVTFDQLLLENVIGCSTVMLARRVAETYRFATDFYHEDYCLWLDILCGGHKAAGCTAVLTDWRLIQNSRSFNKKNSARNRWRIYRGYLKLSWVRSAVAFVCYAVNGVKKYYSKGAKNHAGVTDNA